jgi:hypothetical protein
MTTTTTTTAATNTFTSNVTGIDDMAVNGTATIAGDVMETVTAIVDSITTITTDARQSK